LVALDGVAVVEAVVEAAFFEVAVFEVAVFEVAALEAAVLDVDVEAAAVLESAGWAAFAVALGAVLLDPAETDRAGSACVTGSPSAAPALAFFAGSFGVLPESLASLDFFTEGASFFDGAGTRAHTARTAPRTTRCAAPARA
jgi:hypothetical protein